jgi:hypothetical protein
LNRLAVLTAGCLLLCAASCAKKEPKPLRTEPWLAHPSARASADAALPTTRYTLDKDSLIRFEIPTKRGALSGSVTRVSGELNLDLSNLAQSRGVVRADLGSLEIHGNREASVTDSALLERARAALELSADAGDNTTFASFTLTSVDDASPPMIEPAPERDASASAAFSRRAHFTAVGDLLLHGFRVARRAPLTAEFEFPEDRQVPHRVLIRSRAPFVVSLDTHSIVAVAGEARTKVPASAPARAREVRVSIELYGTKVD